MLLGNGKENHNRPVVPMQLRGESQIIQTKSV